MVLFGHRENCRSLAIMDGKEIAHLQVGASKIAFGGAVQIAAATAENRAILAHSSCRNPAGVFDCAEAILPDNPLLAFNKRFKFLSHTYF